MLFYSTLNPLLSEFLPSECEARWAVKKIDLKNKKIKFKLI